MAEWRTAPDGRAYTEAEFVAWYGRQRGPAMWARATRIPGAVEPGPQAAAAAPPRPQAGGAEEPAAQGPPGSTPPQQPVGADGLAAAAVGAPSPQAGGAEEPAAQAPPREAQTQQPAGTEEPGVHASPAGGTPPRPLGAEELGAHSAPGDASPSVAGGPPSSPPAHRPVLLHAGELAQQRTAALLLWGSMDPLHSAARNELNRLISVQMNAGAGEPGDVSLDFPWPMYIAAHYDATALVGPGIVKLGAAAVAGTRDPNRGGWPRVDFVID